jgi:hypothetical protein
MGGPRDIEEQRQRMLELEEGFQEETEEVMDLGDVSALELEVIEIPPRKSDLGDARVGLVWVPWKVDEAGIAETAH